MSTLWFRTSTVAALAALVTTGGCSGAPPPGVQQAAVTATEDGLAAAYAVFKQTFVNDGQDHRYTIGFGYHPGLSTAKLLVDGSPASGQAILDLDAGTVDATLVAPVNGPLFDLYFVKNAVGTGTVKPERGDQIVKIGSFAVDPNRGPNRHSLTVTIGTAPFPQPGVNFDLDLVVVTPAGQSPISAIVAVGARTMFEKRFFRERAGAALDPVAGTLADDVETSDALVRRGAQLFFHETFGGNGRTCGTCHRQEANLTIDPAFIANLPANDSLFAVPAGLEDPDLLTHGLIRENLDGFEDPTHKFVERSVQHTFSLGASIGEVATAIGANNAPTTGIDGPPPDQRTGWSGDGSPGRGTLQEFAFGAVVQHFTTSLTRTPGSDFRVPTQEELDALEAFQRFTGRQSNVLTPVLTFGDPAATAGRDSALNEGACVACHRDIIGDNFTNFNFDTGVEHAPLAFRTALNMPTDGGFGSALNQSINAFGNGRFNVPPLTDAADTAPFFHNNAFATIEDAVGFYTSAAFLASPGSGFARPQLDPVNSANIAAFLRTINALSNVAQVRRRVQFLAGNATPGGVSILNAARKDVADAIADLTAPSLTSAATANALTALRVVDAILANSAPFANQAPQSPMLQAVAWLNVARQDLIPGNPNNAF